MYFNSISMLIKKNLPPHQQDYRRGRQDFIIITIYNVKKNY